MHAIIKNLKWDMAKGGKRNLLEATVIYSKLAWYLGVFLYF